MQEWPCWLRQQKVWHHKLAPKASCTRQRSGQKCLRTGTPISPTRKKKLEERHVFFLRSYGEFNVYRSKLCQSFLGELSVQFFDFWSWYESVEANVIAQLASRTWRINGHLTGLVAFSSTPKASRTTKKIWIWKKQLTSAAQPSLAPLQFCALRASLVGPVGLQKSFENQRLGWWNGEFVVQKKWVHGRYVKNTPPTKDTAVFFAGHQLKWFLRKWAFVTGKWQATWKVKLVYLCLGAVLIW